MRCYLSCLVLAIAPACAAQESMSRPSPGPAPIAATLTLREPGVLEVGYQIPPSCAALDFRNEGWRPGTGERLRADWRAADDCTEFDGKQIRRKHPSCSTASKCGDLSIR